ncbi:Spo0E family sporulation regulatory protein-aspartic acid phosphatase [Clostridium sp.]
MTENKREVLKEEINLNRNKLYKIIISSHILTEQSLILSEKLDKLILEYYRLK